MKVSIPSVTTDLFDYKMTKYKPASYSKKYTANGLVYPQTTIEKKIGMDIVRQWLTDSCLSPMGRDRVESMEFKTDFEEIQTSLGAVAEMKLILADERNFSLEGISDGRKHINTLKVNGTFVDAPDLHSIRRSLKVSSDISSFFNSESNCWPILTELASGMAEATPVIKYIDRILDPTGNVKDNASPALADIRHRMSTIQNRISSAIRRIMSRAVSDGIIEADTKPAVRSGRVVIPVAAMNKRKISGIVHDESATGKTYFIEPGEVVELGNEQRELEIDERREIVRILIEAADYLRPNAEDLLKVFETLGHLDFILAKAKFANAVGGELPLLSREPIVRWHDARHPVLRLSLERQGRQVVPLDIDLEKPTKRILVVSGPNAGGKSVVLKTVGIVQYMAQSGILPPLDSRSTVGLFERLFVDIGDDQSIEDDLSTYSSHLKNMKYILSHANPRSLVLIDEFGSGTEPQIGGAIAQAILSEFNEMELFGVITTHFQNLKQMAENTVGLVNGSMIYDRNRMLPTFKLSMGHPGSSFAIEIARKTGLPETIITKAEEIVGSDYINLDKYLLDITRDRRYWENKRAEIRRKEKHLDDVIARYEENAENLRSQRRTILEEAKQHADEIIARSNSAIERTIHDIKRVQAEREATREARNKLAEERREIGASTPDENPLLAKAPKPKNKKKNPNTQTSLQSKSRPEVGDNVLLDGQGQPGKIVEINGNKAQVVFGLMKLNVALNRLEKTLRQPSSGAKAASFISSETTDAMRDRQLSFKTEIDVRGMRADEAIQAVTYFIDDALQFNTKRVRILHGTGTGALRLAIRQYLDTVSGVSSFHDEDVRFGGAGITVVEL